MLGALAGTLILAGCDMPGTYSPVAAELANIRLSNVVPKSSARQFVSAFARYCLTSGLEASRSALRKGDYVRAKSRNARIETYVVDNRKPMVMLTGDTRLQACTVSAQARTGQFNRVQDFVAKNYPNARPANPSSIGETADYVWQIAKNPGAFLFTQHGELADAAPYLMFGIWKQI